MTNGDQLVLNLIIRPVTVVLSNSHSTDAFSLLSDVVRDDKANLRAQIASLQKTLLDKSAPTELAGPAVAPKAPLKELRCRTTTGKTGAAKKAEFLTPSGPRWQPVGARKAKWDAAVAQQKLAAKLWEEDQRKEKEKEEELRKQGLAATRIQSWLRRLRSSALVAVTPRFSGAGKEGEGNERSQHKTKKDKKAKRKQNHTDEEVLNQAMALAAVEAADMAERASVVGKALQKVLTKTRVPCSNSHQLTPKIVGDAFPHYEVVCDRCSKDWKTALAFAVCETCKFALCLRCCGTYGGSDG